MGVMGRFLLRSAKGRKLQFLAKARVLEKKRRVSLRSQGESRGKERRAFIWYYHCKGVDVERSSWNAEIWKTLQWKATENTMV